MVTLTQQWRRFIYLVWILTFPLAQAAVADTVTLLPKKDNTLYEDRSGALSNGAGEHFFAGKTGNSLLRRGLLAFDVDGSVSSGATIDSVRLKLHMSRTNPLVGGPANVELRRVSADWGEGTSDAIGEEGAGAPATTGDATWVHRFFNTVLWVNKGGDFSAAASASRVVDDIGFYTWSSAQMTADVQSWLDTPAGNFGWLVLGDEVSVGNTKRFDTRENIDGSFHPMLTIHFTPIPTAIPDDPGVLADLHLEPNYPNPFNPVTTIGYALKRSGLVRLTVHDHRGATIKTLVGAQKSAGTHSVVWDGLDGSGEAVASGVYFVRLESGGQIRSRKVVLLK